MFATWRSLRRMRSLRWWGTQGEQQAHRGRTGATRPAKHACCLTTRAAVQDEALELLEGAEAGTSPAQPRRSFHAGGERSRSGSGDLVEQALQLIAQHCDTAVVTLGERGCIAKSKDHPEVLPMPACSGVQVMDTTGQTQGVLQRHGEEAMVCLYQL